jgi:ATP-dependent DNA helicase RecG
VCASDGATLRPTLAGLLLLGKYPQEFFPQMRVTFVQFYGTTEDEPAPGGARFLDNRSFEGPITSLVPAAELYIMATMRKASLIEGTFRRDIPEYPQVALREALANAVAHRDYSSFVRGTPIGVRMFADRLEVRSPGGLHGNVTLETIEEEHSTRNARLIRMMEDLHIVENRGSGIHTMVRALREANLEPPSFAAQPLNDRQRVALVYLRQHERIINADYRRLNRVEAAVAGQELRGLVELDLVEQSGVGRGTSYALKVARELPEQPTTASEEDRILALAREKGAITSSDCQELLGVAKDRAYYLLKNLAAAGRLRIQGKGRWRKYLPGQSL